MQKKFKMKKIIPFFVLIFWACQGNIQENPAYKKLLSERDSLAGLVSTDIETINQYLSDLNAIQTNLDRIKEAEKLITVNANNTENTTTAKDQINQDLQLIYDLLQQNKNTIDDLRKKLKKSNNKLVELEKMLSNLEKQLTAKNTEIEELKTKLQQMNIIVETLTANIDSLNKENAQKQDIIAQKNKELNTAYYAIGSKKELIENKIITKEGGFIGIGKIEKLRDDFNKDYFTKIDITNINDILINASKAKVITSHPANSYKLKTMGKKVEKLIILDKKSFWSVSKYLVIIIE